MAVRVGVRELRSKLSHYLDRVKNGERVVITERGEPVAELTGPSKYEQLVAAGVITPARRRRRALPPLETLPRIGRPYLSDVVIEDRGR